MAILSADKIILLPEKKAKERKKGKKSGFSTYFSKMYTQEAATGLCE